MRRGAIVVVCVLGGAVAASLRAADDAELRDSIAALSSDRFATREAATVALIAAGEPAVPLAAAAANSTDREARYRGLLVLQRLIWSRDRGARRAARGALRELATSGDGQIARIARETVRSQIDSATADLRASGAALAMDADGQIRSVNFANSSATDESLAPLDQIEPVELNLTNTSITDAALERLASHTQLELLNLMSTKVTDEGMKHVAGLKAMRTFSVERTAVTDAGLNHLKDFAQLKVLYVGGSEVTGEGLQHVEHLPIEYLSFAYSPVGDSVVEHVVRIKSLKTLGLDDTKVTDACLPALAALENLEVLWLDNCAITDAAVAHLKRLAKLKTLHVQNTKISARGIAELKLDRKDLTIIGAPAR